MNILLIEDNPDHAFITRRTLEGKIGDCRIDVADEAHKGLEQACAGSYDVILCDYRMAGLSALEMLRKMREEGREYPFIVVTSSGSEKIAVELMKEGAYDYVVKDSAYEETLPIVVQRALDRFDTKKEKEKLQDQLQKSNDKLKEMYAIKSDFTSMVSHELRTPLAAIQEGISIVLDETAGSLNHGQKEFLNIAKSNVERLNRLINDVLDFSKLESRKMTFRISAHDINRIIRDTVCLQKHAAEGKKLYLETVLEEGLPRIDCDPDRITQVLSNLISNAVKFTAAGGITISSRKDGQEKGIIVAVQDTGAGIKDEDVGRLFQKFQQISKDSGAGGTGLGLAICKEIIGQHGGRIWIESAFGRGSAFKFSIPVVRSPKVLVIDDEEIVLETCERLLVKDGYRVLKSREGAAGLQMIEAETPDLIMLDIRLKDISGYEVIGRLRSIRAGREIPILLMTGYKEEVRKIEGSPAAPALPLLAKPFDREELLSKIKSALSPSKEIRG